jgi:DHA1 family multidrug resistance protein-like MFS transporter
MATPRRPRPPPIRPTEDPGAARSGAWRDGQLILLFVCVFVVWVGYGITLTVLPYFTERVHVLAGADRRMVAVHVGFLTSVYALAQLVAGPVVGRLGDRLGRRPLLLMGLAGLGLTQALFGFTSSLAQLYALRVAGGLAASLLTVAATAYIADRTSTQRRAEGMAWFGTVASLGLVGGPVVGAVLSRVRLGIGSPPLRLDGYSLPFVFAGTLALVVFVAALVALPESLPAAPSGSSAGARGERRRAYADPLLGLVAASAFGLALFEGTFVLYARDRLALRPSETATAFVVCGLVMGVLSVLVVGRLARWVSPLGQVAGGFVLMGSGTGALMLARQFGLLLGSVGLLSAGMALVTPNLASLVAARGEGRRVGEALGLKSSASSLGQFLGPLVGAPLLAWRANSPYALATALLLALGFGLVFSGPTRRQGLAAPGADHPPPP